MSRNLPSAPSRVLATASLVIEVPYLRDRRGIAARTEGLDHGGNACVVGTRDHELDGRRRAEGGYEVRISAGTGVVGNRVRVLGRQPPPGVLGDRLLADGGERGAGVHGVVVDELTHVVLAPPGPGEQPRVLGRQYHE